MQNQNYYVDSLTNAKQREKELIEYILDRSQRLPDENEDFIEGIKWGHCCQLYTPAFWKMQYWLCELNQEDTGNYRIGKNIIEEVVACLLGGYGLPSEMGLLAYERLKERKLLQPNASFHKILGALSEPFSTQRGMVKYRFYNTKAKYIHEFLTRRDIEKIPLHDEVEFRNWLLTINGVGYKTASWITRN